MDLHLAVFDILVPHGEPDEEETAARKKEYK
jgi:hypothetical protein